MPANSQKTTSELLSDLGGDDGPDRLYAARVLKVQLRRGLRWLDAPSGSLARDEALSTLDELEARLPSHARLALAYKNTVAVASEMLVLLDDKSALSEVQAAYDRETRKGARRRLAASITALSAP